ncbi:Protein BUD31-like [Durusdinium trenchii]|uniref:Protein BUD31-like n=1 Tax=Durusdinium trenchii TaxID=1381693 RepID=A0ABP0MWK4_9DINO
MELEVARHSGIPESSILSVRIGSTRRLVHLNQLERPMKFPLRPEECTSIKVDVMDLSGTARVACQAKTTEYTIPLETTDEVPSATGMEVTVKLKPQGADSAAIDEELEKKKEDAAKAYLEKHGLTSFMQFLIQSLMKDKPSDPYAFMQRQVTKRVVASQARGTETDKQLDDILQKLSAEVSESVPAEQLQSLQEQAEAAGAQLRKDNEELRGMLEMLKTRYKVLLQENTELAKQVGEDPSGVDLISMKDDVGGLVNENALLVSELTSMRKKIETMKGQVGQMKFEEAS